MVCKITIILTLLMHLLPDSYGLSIPQNVKKPAPNTSILKDILAEIKDINGNTCPTSKQILESDYVKECDKLTFPPVNTTLTTSNYDTFLCLALYDRTFHMCYHSALGAKIPSLRNKTAFDSMISEEIKSPSINGYKVCDSLQNSPPAMLNKTRVFVEELSTALKDDCLDICWNKALKKINPLCLVVQIIDDEIEKEVVDNVEEKGEKSQSPNVQKSKPESKDITEVPKNALDVPKKVNPVSTQTNKSGKPTLEKGLPAEKISNPITNANEKISEKDIGGKKGNEEVKANSGADQTQKVETDKGNSPTQEQSPPVPITEEKKGLPKEAAPPKDENSPSQIIPPGKEGVEKELEKSTVSENTGGADGDAQMENYGSNEGISLG